MFIVTFLVREGKKRRKSIGSRISRHLFEVSNVASAALKYFGGQ